MGSVQSVGRQCAHSTSTKVTRDESNRFVTCIQIYVLLIFSTGFREEYDCILYFYAFVSNLRGNLP